MNIKEFRPGQEAYIVDLHTGRNEPPSIHQTKVVTVGRKYVTTNHYGKKYKTYSDPYGLIEQTGWGEATYLCPDKEKAQMRIDHEDLRLWLYKAAAHGNKYTLDQLKQVKEILD